MSIHEKIIQIGNHSIYTQFIESELPAPSPLIVFLHEGLGCVEMWKGFPEKLCALTGYSGFLYDRKGYGKSTTWQSSLSIDFLKEEARELPDVLQKAGIHQPVILLGHSDGGSIALYAASDPRLDVKAVIVEAPHVLIEEETRLGLLQTRQLWESGILTHKLKKYHGDKAGILFQEWIRLWLSEVGLQWQMLDDLIKIKAPLLFIQGDRDHFATMKQWDEIQKRVQGNKEKIFIEKCGHIPHLEMEKFVTTSMADFLKSLKV